MGKPSAGNMQMLYVNENTLYCQCYAALNVCTNPIYRSNKLFSQTLMSFPYRVKKRVRKNEYPVLWTPNSKKFTLLTSLRKFLWCLSSSVHTESMKWFQSFRFMHTEMLYLAWIFLNKCINMKLDKSRSECVNYDWCQTGF